MNLAAGNALVIFARSAVPNSSYGVSLASVSDGGDTFTLGAFCNYSSPGGLQAAWATNIAANSSAAITATFSANAQYRALWAVQVSGVSAADVTGGACNNAYSGAVTSASFSTSYPKEMLLAATTAGSLSETYTAGSGYTLGTAFADADMRGEYQVVSGTQSGVTAGFALAPSTSWNASVVTLYGSGTTASIPVISAVTSGGITAASATITWTTDQASSSQVEYGPTTPYASISSLNSALVALHSVTLTGLTPGTAYNYAVLSADSAGTATSANFTFSTPATIPTISAVTASGITATSATITWTTDQASSSQAEYGATTAYGFFSALNSSPVTSHSVTLTGLTPGTSYDYAPLSTNSAGTATSANFTFSTPVQSQTPLSQCVSASAQGTSTTVSCSTTMNLAPGNTLVIFARSAVPNSSSGVSLASVSDGGDTFTLGAFCNYSSPGGLQAAWATNIAANSSATITATFSANAQYRALWAVQVSGVSGVDVTGGACNNAFSGTAVTSATFSTSYAKEILLAATTAGSLSETYTAGSGYTLGTAFADADMQGEYQVVSGTQSGVTAGFALSPPTSWNASVVTLYTASTTASIPVISAVTSGGVTSTSATITWTTDQASSSQVEYGPTAGYGSVSALNSFPVTSHSVTLTSLTPGTAYTYAVLSADLAGTATSANFAFSTPATIPTISAVTASSITAASATITWTTDQASSSQAEYGATITYGSFSALNSSPVTSHSVTLTGLTPSTAYNYAVLSTNSAGTATSTNFTFSTLALPQTLVSQCVSASAQGISNTVSCSTTMNLAAGNTLVIFARSAVPNSGSGVALSSVSDGGDTFTLGAFCNYSSPGGLQAAWATNVGANSSATITATFSANAQYRALWAVQVSGVSAADVTGGACNDAYSGAVTSASFSTSYSKEILLAAATAGSLSETYTPGSGYTLGTAFADEDMQGEYQIVSGTQSGVTAGFALSASTAWSASVVSLYNVTPTPPSITTTSLPTAFTGTVYSQTLTATGTTPMAWVVTSGALPAGLSLGSSTGMIGGTPTTSGVFTPTITATNAGGSNSKQLSLTVSAPVTVSLTPTSVTLQPSQSQPFSATVTGASNAGVTWSLSPALGSLATTATTAVYVAPSTAPTTQSVTITATSVADTTKIATAVITLLQAVTVSLSPSAVSLTSSGTQQFTPTVLGTSNTAVTWSISPAVGAISAAGLYTAPANLSATQTVTVTAQSAAAPGSSGNAAVTLTPVTYYVDSANGSDSNPGTEAAPWQTIAKVNATPLSPGQTVAFRAGDVWREQLTVYSGGSAGNPVTFTSYGGGPSPVISGANVVSSWTSGPPYYASYTTAPSQVFRNGAPLSQVSSQSALLTGTWWLDTADSRIYVYDNPSGNTMEASQRTYGVLIGNASYVTVSGLAITKANNEGVGIFTGSNYVTVANCNISYSYSNGIAVWSATPSISYGVIQGNTVSNSGGSGIGVSQNATFWTIQNNIVYGNSGNPANNPYTAGIAVGNSSVSNITVQYNQVYSNGLGQPTNIGFGIHVDIQSPHNVIRWNNAYGNNDCNILVEISENNQIYGNLVYGSIQSCGIGVRGASGTPASGNVVFNNTIYGNLASQNLWAGGLLAYGDGTTGSFVNNTFENNISVGNGAPQLNVFGGAENDGTNGYGNVYAYNDFGPDATNFIKWGSSTNYSTLAAWQAASGQAHNLDANPLFTNPGAGVFTLQSGSPAIGAGVYIPGVSTANPPNIGAE